MQHVVILGAGTAGTVMANRLARRYKTGLRTGQMRITLVDQDPLHVYQPGLLFIPFGSYTRDQVLKPRAAQVNDAVRYVQSGIAALDPAVIGIRAGAQVPDMDTLVSVPGMDHRWRYRPGDGVARLVDPAGRASHLVRPWCAATGDLLGFERLHASSGENGLRLVGYDIETGPGGTLRIAAHPAPRAAEIRITTP